MFKGKAKRLTDAVTAPIYEKLSDATGKLTDATNAAYTVVKEDALKRTQALKEAAAQKAAEQVFNMVRPVVKEAAKPPFIPEAILFGAVKVKEPYEQTVDVIWKEVEDLMTEEWKDANSAKRVLFNELRIYFWARAPEVICSAHGACANA